MPTCNAAPHVATALRDTVPIVLSVAPFALVVGATATTIGLPVLPGLSVAATVFAGSAHYAALNQVAAGAGALTVLTTVALINARLTIYSAALEPRFRHQPGWFRWLGPALLVDQTYLMVLGRDDLDTPVAFRRYWTSAGTALMACWVALVALGGVLVQHGPLLPAGTPLDAAAVVVLTGMLAPRLTAPRPVVVAGTALIVAVVAAPLPQGLGLICGIVAGVLVGAVLDRSRP
jgi:predicted branched-subunit amino acid permease